MNAITLTPERTAELFAIRKTKWSAAKALKINSLAELPADLFDRAKAKLETMRVPL